MGEPVDLTPGVDLVAYRVIEAALRTAADRTSAAALVTIRYTPHELELDIRGDGAMPDLDAEPRGDRAARRAVRRRACGPGAAADGGFALRARLPLGQRRPGMTIAILIADDQALVRTGFRMILETDPGLRVVAEANDGAQAVEAARRSRPDIVLMDIRMPGMDGLEATRRIIAAQDPPRVLMLTTFDLDEYVFDALVAGASGFLLKDVAPEQLLAGIRIDRPGRLAARPVGHPPADRAFIRDHRPTAASTRARRADRPRARDPRARRTRSLQRRDRRPARRLGTTIKTHVARVLVKLDLRDRVQAVVLAYETGIVRPGTTR